jgi:hypothetical protein
MATIVYLDVDDEITSAASRIRAARHPRVAIVVPYGSRVATSRINFRLLAREAQAADRRLDVIAPDAAARALAASAGIPVFTSVAEYETALEVGDEDEGEGPAAAAGTAGAEPSDDRGGEEREARDRRSAEPRRHSKPRPEDPVMGSPEARPRRPSESEAVGAGAAASGVAAGALAMTGPANGTQYRTGDRTARRRRIPVWLIPVAGMLALALVATGVAAYVALPAAQITVTPRIERIGPLTLQVRADPDAATVDLANGRIPAERVEIPLEATGEFVATGTRVDERRATGRVRFASINTVGPVAVPSGTRVATLDGIVFETTQRVTVPAASVAGDRIERGFAEAAIRAVKAGPEANVAAGSITQVPDVLRTQQISVDNAGATQGGRRDTFPVVQQADVDNALLQLRADLDTQLETALEDPEDIPAGATPLPETVTMDEPVPGPDPAELVGQEVQAFTLGMTTTARLLAVDSGPVEGIARTRLEAAVGEGYELIDGSIEITVGEAAVRNGEVTFPVSGTAQQTRPVDAAEIEAAVLGRSRAHAEEILARYGTAEIELWPDWVDSVPALEQRVEVTVRDPVEVPAAPTPRPSPTPRSTPSPEPDPDADGTEPVPSP